MLGRTHDLVAFTCVIAAAIFLPVSEISVATALVAVLAAMIGGLLPDMDQASADFWDAIPVGEVLGRIFSKFVGKHRGISHSLIGIILVYVISSVVVEVVRPYVLVDFKMVHVAFLIGYLSHLLADSLTESGIPLFFPDKFKFGMPPVRAVRIKTGGWFEKLIVFPGLVVLNFYLFYQHYGVLVGKIVK